MVYENGTATSIQNLFDKLSTFATTLAGWTADGTPTAGRLYLTKSAVSVAFRWDTTAPTNAGIYQHTAFINDATQPGNHTNDSGQGVVSGTNATILTGRNVLLNNAGMQYWFYANDTYIHVVVETTTATVFNHFGFGTLVKFGTWTGGEYSYGSRQSNLASSASVAIRDDTTALLDGLSAVGGGSQAEIQVFVASLHVEGLPGEGASSKWGLCQQVTPNVNDRQASPQPRVQIVGGYRAGPTCTPFARFSGTVLQGLQPLTPINLFYKHLTLARLYPLGTMPDVRQCNIKNYVGGQEITIGADTWTLFPSRKKAAGSGTGDETENQGIAYKKIP